MTVRETKIEHATAMRYERPALASLGWYDMIKYLEEIQGKVDEYRYAFESESILNALDCGKTTKSGPLSRCAKKFEADF